MAGRDGRMVADLGKYRDFITKLCLSLFHPQQRKKVPKFKKYCNIKNMVILCPFNTSSSVNQQVYLQQFYLQQFYLYALQNQILFHRHFATNQSKAGSTHSIQKTRKLAAQTKDSTPILLPLKLPRFLIQIRIAN